MRILTKTEALDYLKEHAEPAGGKWHSNFYRVTKELKVFKKAYTGGVSVIVNLVIPVGAIVHFPENRYSISHFDYRKMRASKAVVHSIVTKYQKDQINTCHSNWDRDFKYKVGKTVEPAGKMFGNLPYQCQSGIHFFLQLEDALSYN